MHSPKRSSTRHAKVQFTHTPVRQQSGIARCRPHAAVSGPTAEESLKQPGNHQAYFRCEPRDVVCGKLKVVHAAFRGQKTSPHAVIAIRRSPPIEATSKLPHKPSFVFSTNWNSSPPNKAPMNQASNHWRDLDHFRRQTRVSPNRSPAPPPARRRLPLGLKRTQEDSSL